MCLGPRIPYVRIARLVRYAAVVLLASVPAVGHQEPPTTATAKPPASQPVPDAPYWLRVTADELNVRTQPDANSIVVARIPRDTVLRSLGLRFGWERVEPPANTFCYVAAEYVRLEGDAEGVVATQTGGLRVRAGSHARDLDPAQSEVLGLLERGTRVRVVGRDGAWLRIGVPEGITFYIAGQHVQRISSDVAARLEAARMPRPPDAAGPAPASQPVAAEPALTGPWGRKLAVVETDLMAEGRKPPLERDWARFVTQLEPLAAQREEPVTARLAAAWLLDLKQRIADQNMARATAELSERAARERAQHERELERIERLREQTTSRPATDAAGLLLRSYLGGTATRYGFKLQDPVTQQVVAYLDLETAPDLDLAELLGQYVGVQGRRHPDADLGADVIQVRRIEAVRREEAASQPARQNP